MEQWSSKLGFLLAAIGSAVGIGNIWRFSAVLGQNGGGAYLVPFLIAVFLFALPLMVLELAVGRQYRTNVVTAFATVRPEFRILGWLLCATVFLVLSYYLVIAGWTVGYTLISLSGEVVSFSEFTTSWLPVAFFLFTAVATGVIVSQGIQKGIERISVVLIPVSVGILVFLAAYGVTLPGFSEGIRYLFTPDFSVLADPLLWSAAFGQAFFSLSVGTGILLTYGSYVGKDQSLPSSALTITLADVFVALLSGIVIFPIVFSFGLAPTVGAELAFTTLPRAFAAMPGGILLAVAFFLVLFFASITSAISMLEVSVSAIRESLHWSRARATLLLTGGVIAAGLPSALSYSTMNLSFGGVRVLDFMDETVGTLGLPVAAVLLAVAFTWFVPAPMLEAEIGRRLSRVIYPLCRYVIPPVLIVTTAARLLSGYDFPDTRNLPGSEFIGTLLQAEGFFVIVGILIVAYYLFCRFRNCRLSGIICRRK